ncbi:MAG: CAP domain-containing protein [Arachnia sp.]
MFGHPLTTDRSSKRARPAAWLAAVSALALTLGAWGAPARAASFTNARTTAVNAQPTQSTVRAEVLAEINKARSTARTCGTESFDAAAPLTENTALDNASYLHSKDMAVNDYFAHNSQDGTSPFERMKKAGYSYRSAGENIAAGYSDAGAVVAGWLSSPGHCQNIMNPGFTDIGIGVYYDAGSTYGVYWTNAFGSGTSSTTPDVVPSAKKLSTAKPSISGTLRVGKKLTAKPGTWGPKPVTLTYQWYRNGAKITGATASTYTLTASDRGKRIKVVVRGTKSGYSAASVSSAETAKVGYGTLTSAKPTISGTRKVGKKLTAKAGTWGPKPVKLTYQWYRNGTKITGATASTYTLKKADANRQITVKVKGAKSGYTSTTVTSAKTSKIKK